jgi:hypothetical protein
VGNADGGVAPFACERANEPRLHHQLARVTGLREFHRELQILAEIQCCVRTLKQIAARGHITGHTNDQCVGRWLRDKNIAAARRRSPTSGGLSGSFLRTERDLGGDLLFRAAALLCVHPQRGKDRYEDGKRKAEKMMARCRGLHFDSP